MDNTKKTLWLVSLFIITLGILPISGFTVLPWWMIQQSASEAPEASRTLSLTSASITQNLGVINKMIIGSDTIDDLPSVTNLRIIASGESAYALDIYNPSTLTNQSSRLTLRTGKTDQYYSGFEFDIFNISEDPGMRGLIQCYKYVGATPYPLDLGIMCANVGIGTTTPQTKLHVNGVITSNCPLFFQSADVYASATGIYTVNYASGSTITNYATDFYSFNESGANPTDLILTFLKNGWYRVNFNGKTLNSTSFTKERITIAYAGGTATYRGLSSVSQAYDYTGSYDIAVSNTIFVSANAGETLKWREIFDGNVNSTVQNLAQFTTAVEYLGAYSP